MITKKSFTNMYQNFTIEQVMKVFKISRVKVYELKNQYGVEDKSNKTAYEKWLDTIPDDIEADDGASYRKKWKGYKSQPISFWFTDEDAEEKYLINKTETYTQEEIDKFSEDNKELIREFEQQINEKKKSNNTEK
jgi:glycine cleavage system protein P-like pyridoxal-binding family